MSKVLQDRGLDHIELEVDGGIKLENLKKVADAGADIFVSGSGIFKAENPVIQIQKMKELIQPKAMV